MNVRNGMIESIAHVHMTEAELAGNLHVVLEKVRQGTEVIIEEGFMPIVVLTPAPRSGRPISECIALAKARGSRATIDDAFAREVEEAIALHREPWNPTSWD